MVLNTTNQPISDSDQSSTAESINPPIQNHKSFVLKIASLALLFIVVAAGAYYLGTTHTSDVPYNNPTSNGNNSQSENPTATPSEIPTQSPAARISSNPKNTPATVVVPANWARTKMINDDLTLCLPPNWEADEWGNIYFNRDTSYRPNVTYIQEIPYTSGSRREAYYKFWESEYSNVRELVSIEDTSIGSNTALTIFAANPNKTDISPDGSLAVVWYSNGKLWKANLDSWKMINDSQSNFLKDFYSVISCSF